MTSEKLAEFRAKGMLLDPKFDRLAQIGDRKKAKEDEKTSKEIIINPVITYQWCDINKNNFKNGALKYGQTDLGIEIIFNKNFLKKTAILKIYSIAKNGKFIESIKTLNLKITTERVYISIDPEELFQKCDYEINNFKVDITVDDKLYEGSIDNSVHEILKIHFVILIPSIMKALNWKNSVRTQEDWFNSKRNYYPWDVNPSLSYFSLGNLLQFKHFKEFYEEKINSWKNNDAALNSLRNEIKKIKKNKLIQFPTTEGQITEFGTFDSEIITKIIKPDEFKNKKIKTATERIPLFEEYYFYTELYKISKFVELDDFYGAIANCNIRYAAKGILTSKNKEIVVTIKKIGIYIKDGFDFTGSQGLGEWSYKNKTVSKALFDLISDKSYEEYSKDSNMGRSSYHYSNMYIYKQDYNFNL